MYKYELIKQLFIWILKLLSGTKLNTKWANSVEWMEREIVVVCYSSKSEMPASTRIWMFRGRLTIKAERRWINKPDKLRNNNNMTSKKGYEICYRIIYIYIVCWWRLLEYMFDWRLLYMGFLTVRPIIQLTTLAATVPLAVIRQTPVISCTPTCTLLISTEILDSWSILWLTELVAKTITMLFTFHTPKPVTHSCRKNILHVTIGKESREG